VPCRFVAARKRGSSFHAISDAAAHSEQPARRSARARLLSSPAGNNQLTISTTRMRHIMLGRSLLTAARRSGSQSRQRCAAASGPPPDDSLNLPSSLPELRACYQEQMPMAAMDVAATLGADPDAKFINSTFFHSCFDAICDRTLEDLPRTTSAVESIRSTPGDKWCKTFGSIAMDDTLLLGVRAEIDSKMVEHGRFVHHYIAWSKAQQRVAAHGGVIVSCEDLDGRSVRIPDAWVYQMEVAFGDAWAACKILEFRRAAGLPNHMLGHTLSADDDL
jgi:hypothetical protein